MSTLQVYKFEHCFGFLLFLSLSLSPPENKGLFRTFTFPPPFPFLFLYVFFIWFLLLKQPENPGASSFLHFYLRFLLNFVLNWKWIFHFFEVILTMMKWERRRTRGGREGGRRGGKTVSGEQWELYWQVMTDWHSKLFQIKRARERERKKLESHWQQHANLNSFTSVSVSHSLSHTFQAFSSLFFTHFISLLLVKIVCNWASLSSAVWVLGVRTV